MNLEIVIALCFYYNATILHTHFQRSGHIRLGSLTDALLRFGVDTFPALPQYHINLHINQQSDDEGNIKGHYGRVYHKGWIGDHTERLIPGSC